MLPIIYYLINKPFFVCSRNLPACPRCGFRSFCCMSHIKHMVFAHDSHQTAELSDYIVCDEYKLECACGIAFSDGDKMGKFS